MPLDPQAQALIASLAGTKPVEEMTVQEMRDGMVERHLNLIGAGHRCPSSRLPFGLDRADFLGFGQMGLFDAQFVMQSVEGDAVLEHSPPIKNPLLSRKN